MVYLEDYLPVVKFNGLNTNKPTTFGSTIGFYGKTAQAQPTAATNVHTVAAGATTSVYVNTTFDGTIGSTAYTIGDIVAALKTLGLIAS